MQVISVVPTRAALGGKEAEGPRRVPERLLLSFPELVCRAEVRDAQLAALRHQQVLGLP